MDCAPRFLSFDEMTAVELFFKIFSKVKLFFAYKKSIFLGTFLRNGLTDGMVGLQSCMSQLKNGDHHCDYSLPYQLVPTPLYYSVFWPKFVCIFFCIYLGKTCQPFLKAFCGDKNGSKIGYFMVEEIFVKFETFYTKARLSRISSPLLSICHKTWWKAETFSRPR